MRITSSVITAFLLLSGCVGGVDDINTPPPTPDGGTTTTAKQGKTNYIANVHPIMLRCSGAGCHSQGGVTGMYGFAIGDAGESYEQVIKLPTLVGTYTQASAPMFTKIGNGPTPIHNAILYTADEVTKINGWFAQEIADRNTQDPTMPPPPPLIDAAAKLREWSGCMKLADFNTAQMAQKWGALAASNAQRCANCHGGGAFAFMSGNGTADIFFSTITTQKDLLLKYFTVDAMGLVIINNAAFNNAGVALPAGGTSNHPAFNPTTNAGMDALLAFYNLAKAHQTAATCDPPRLPM
jgi:hypothetical protein